MSFARYTKYKDSGVEWLGDVPDHWKVRSLRHSCSAMFNGLTATQVSETNQTVPVTRIETISNGEIDESRLGFIGVEDARPDRLLRTGDVLFSNINSLNKIGNCAYYASARSIYAGMNLLVLRPTTGIYPRWFFWQVRAAMFRQVVESLAKPAINQASISQSSLSGIALSIPTSREQKAISDFLDSETTKIDTLIAEQQRLIELLKEKRQAAISHAVTKGLNPDAPMKPSGVEWLGDVPKDWRVMSVKHLVESFEQGWSPQCEASPVENDDEWGVLKVGCVNGGGFNSAENKALPEELAPITSLTLCVGDLLISRANTRELVGGAAVVERDYPKLMLCDKLYRLRTNKAQLDPWTLALYLGTPAARGQIELQATGASASMVNISQSTILGLFVPVPPIAEQQEILKAVGVAIAALDVLTAEAERAITLLQERRSALISAAVTGKIDVSHRAASYVA